MVVVQQGNQSLICGGEGKSFGRLEENVELGIADSYLQLEERFVSSDDDIFPVEK